MTIKTAPKALLFVAFAVVGGQAAATPCSRYESDKAQVLADEAGKRLVGKLGGGRDLRVEVRDCDFNTYNNRFRLKVQIYWNGAIFRDNAYNVDGDLSFGSSGADSEFNQTYANQNVRDLKFWGGLAIGVIGLGVLAGTSSTASTPAPSPAPQPAVPQNNPAPASARVGAPVVVSNSCSDAVRLLIHFRDMTGHWKSAGWWVFDPKERASLSLQSKEVRTDNALIYFYATSTDGIREWKGEHNVDFEGKKYPMRQVKDDSQTRTEISLSCP
jgi:uncharacterized membrane protein